MDSEDEVIRMDSETTLKQEIAWASHLSLQVCMMLTVFQLWMHSNVYDRLEDLSFFVQTILLTQVSIYGILSYF